MWPGYEYVFNDVLTGWESIAEFLGVSVEDCKLLNEALGMPIQRNTEDIFFALPMELDTWIIAYSDGLEAGKRMGNMDTIKKEGS